LRHRPGPAVAAVNLTGRGPALTIRYGRPPAPRAVREESADPGGIRPRGSPPMHWPEGFGEALSYGAFLDTFATPAQRQRWDAMHGRFGLSAEQAGLLGGFTRRMPVVCLAGAWCGDCINQCPVFDHFARAASAIDLRFLDRDALPEVREALMINGGQRVPVVVFLSEDWHEVSRYGERALSIYRKLAAHQPGPPCPTRPHP